ncbi:MAG: transcription-repair coupling factor [Clostridia bacterium]|nr:transcription-repair coupling factor [Clostridia bacterium]
MNYELTSDVLRSRREFALFKRALFAAFGKDTYRTVLAEGLCDGAFELFVRTLAKDLEESAACRILVICPDEKDASRLSDLLNAQGVVSYFYPAKDFNFNNITASRDTEHERLSVLCALSLTDAPAVICTTPEAALQATIPQDVLESHSLLIDRRREVDLDMLVSTLSESGYARVDLVDGIGQFAVRGGVIDVFPPADYPLRIELFGDEIDRMGHFDIMTQRMTDSADVELIPPVKETIIDDEAALRVEKTIKKLIKNAPSDRTKEELSAELSALQNLADVPFADKYMPAVYGKDAQNLVSYFNGVIAVRDFSNCAERHKACDAIFEETVKDMLTSGEIDGATASFEFLSPWQYLEYRLKDMPSFFADVFTRSYQDIAIKEVFDFASQSKLSYSSNVSNLLEDLAYYRSNGYMCTVFCDGEAQEKNLYKILLDASHSPVIADGNGAKVDGADIGGVFFSDKGKTQPTALICGAYPSGFEIPKFKIAVFDFSSEAVAKRRPERAAKRKRSKNAKAIMSYHDLVPGDFVVHDIYGIGLYEGIENLTIDGVSRDYVHIKYAGKDKLFLPVDQLDMVSKYVGNSEDSGVRLSKMGGADWNRSKARAKSAARDMAKELIELYAKRKRIKGISFDSDDAMSAEFAETFEYEETDSQTAAITDVSRDMEKSYPMDRMICGDVGYGKTEVAMRAAFKAVSSGYQVAILVPTTILAYQHYQTFSARFRGFPVSVDMLSRFRTPSQRALSVRKLKRGETDIIIGTHRLISKDVEFSKLGLIIIDEEQRFGVAQKEKLKQIAPGADVLTLSATPIPRTLNMALGGIVDMSLLDDVPGLRSPVQTYVLEHDDEILYEAMRRELRRGGQVFYLHNKIENIHTVASKIQKALPDARVAVGHGRLERSEIEDIWSSLVRGDVDILVSTTIIETGVDIPNANTLIIDNADRYGLSQLHQIRGRVGRSSRKAYAYFTYPKSKLLSEIAERRLRAIKEYASFGAGFKIAMRDMEIRGAGNLLGAEQHGHIDSVGYDMYLKLLNEAVLEEEGEVIAPAKECAVSLKVDAFIPKSYISDAGQRMEMYKKIARISTEEDFDDVIDEFCDRFGDIPSPVIALCTISHVRSVGVVCGITKIEQRDRTLSFYPETPDPFMLTDLISRFPKGSANIHLTSVCTLDLKLPKGEKIVDFAKRAVIEYKKSYDEARDQALSSGEEHNSEGIDQ